MAGATNIGEGSDNPVDTNVVPMIDVIFCLCLFFMCSFHFKQLEGKIESWLPDKGGQGQVSETPPPLEDIRISMFWDKVNSRTNIQVGSRQVRSDSELESVLLASVNDFKKMGKLDVPANIDAEAPVPWEKVVGVMDVCKNAKIEKIEFTEPWPAGAGPVKQ